MSSEPDAQISRRSIGEWVRDRYFSGTGLIICGKKRVLEGGEGKTKLLRGRGGVESIVSLKTDLRYLYL